ncbi:MAG TPA: GNAT family N-acetyltransferase [Catenuloplanes sp.]
MGVARPYRRRGVGRLLLRAILNEANDSGLPAVSLSVERANVAVLLYTSMGFRTVASAGNADTMLIGREQLPVR